MNSRQKYIAFLTIFTKEIKRSVRLWKQTFLPSIVTTSLYFLIFGTFIGSQIQATGGVSYMAFIVPGLVMMAVLTSSFQGMVSSFYFLKFQKTVEEILVSPMPAWLVVVGYLSAAVTRGLIIGTLVFGSAYFFQTIPVAHPLLALGVIVLTATFFALIGLINAIYAKSFDDISIIPTFVLTPLTYLGGVFYSVSLLSPLWQTVSHSNPILYMVNAFRFSILGFSDIPVIACILVLLVAIALAFSWVIYLFTTGRGLRT